MSEFLWPVMAGAWGAVAVYLNGERLRWRAEARRLARMHKGGST